MITLHLGSTVVLVLTVAWVGLLLTAAHLGKR